jgi:RND family efflux transporter MFP subunit
MDVGNCEMNGVLAMNDLARSSVSLIFLLAAFAGTSLLSGAELESFTEPYRRVAVPATEIGVLAEILVSEGDHVSQKQLLAKLDDTVLIASLDVARAAKNALGSRNGAEVELAIRAKQLESFRELLDRGNATPREVERAEGEHLQAQARMQSIREDLEVRRLEYERVKAQIRSRQLESPMDGHVVQIDKEVGEFVAPTDPVVMHIVQLTTLKSVFSVPMQKVSELQKGDTVNLLIGYEPLKRQGVIEFISPIAEAQSATVRVKIRIPNQDGLIPSGAFCRWDLRSTAPARRVSRTPDDPSQTR